MTITPTLIRWSRTSNRRRAVELGVLGLPWMVAGVAATLATSQVAGLRRQSMSWEMAPVRGCSPRTTAVASAAFLGGVSEDQVPG